MGLHGKSMLLGDFQQSGKGEAEAICRTAILLHKFELTSSSADNQWFPILGSHPCRAQIKIITYMHLINHDLLN